MLRLGMTLLRRLPIIGGGIGEIGENPLPTGIEQSQTISASGSPTEAAADQVLKAAT